MNLAIVARGEKKPEQVKLYLTRARQEAEELVRQHPNNREYSYLLGWAFEHLGIFCSENGQMPQAAPLLEKGLHAMRKAIDANWGNLEQQAELARCYHNLGSICLEQGNSDRAAGPIQESVAIRERLSREHPEVWQLAFELAHGLVLLGQLHDAKHESESVVESLSRALDTLNPIAANPLAAAQVRPVLREVLGGRSQALIDLKRYADAVKDLDRAIALADGEQRMLLRLVRANALAHSGNHRRAAEEAEAVLGDPSFPADGIFTVACLFGLIAAREADREKADRYAQRAVHLLARAQGAGFFNAVDRRGLLDSHPDLAALRGKKEFESLKTKMKE
jgi:tetratricopeptide (TPR) repeat protein